MKSTSEIMTVYCFGLSIARNSHALKLGRAVSSHRPGIRGKVDGQLSLELERLSKLLWTRKWRQAESCQFVPGGLLAEYLDLGALLTQECGNGEKQRARAG